jgi:predicted nucleotidyltransferase
MKMNVIGLIVEYNPLHNGHLYQLEYIKNNFKDYILIVIMNSYFSQRGEAIIIDKNTKVKLMLKYGIDIIIENPTFFSSSSADTFAYSSLFLLNKFKIDTLVFGSESCDISLLNKLARYELFDKEFNLNIKKYLDKGNSYKESYNKVIYDKYNIKALNSNDILNLCYIKEIIKNNYNIKVVPIKRFNLNNITSASNIRELFFNNKINNIKKYVPKEVYTYLKNNKFNMDLYFKILKYKIITTNNLNIYKDIDEGFDNRIKKYINLKTSYDDFVNVLISKRYKINNIKRKLNNIFLNILKEDNYQINYIKILGISNKGRCYLKNIKKYIDIKIISNNEKGFPLLDKEIQIEKLYYLITNKNKEKNDHTIINS